MRQRLICHPSLDVAGVREPDKVNRSYIIMRREDWAEMPSRFLCPHLVPRVPYVLCPDTLALRAPSTSHGSHLTGETQAVAQPIGLEPRVMRMAPVQFFFSPVDVPHHVRHSGRIYLQRGCADWTPLGGKPTLADAALHHRPGEGAWAATRTRTTTTKWVASLRCTRRGYVRTATLRV